MRKIAALLLSLIFVALATNAQLKDEDYRKQADEVRKYVWTLKIKAFDDRTVPAEYAKYSKVILAKHEEIIALTKSRIKWIGLGVMALRDLTFTHTTRELVKINDAVALKDYSEITFKKFAQVSKDRLTTYLGVRVIKADGTLVEIDPDEIVLTNNAAKNKEGKLAISDLQIGDMIDYFIQTVEFYSGGTALDPQNFVYADEDPIMHYSVHIEASSKMALQYRAMNGAPEFKESRNDDNDIILDAEKNNIPAFPTSLWMSPFRQLPVLRVVMVFMPATIISYASRIKAGEVYRNPEANQVIDEYSRSLKGYVADMRKEAYSYEMNLKVLANAYCKANGISKIKDDSRSLYYAAKHYFFLRPDKDDVAVVDNRRNYSAPREKAFLAFVESLLDRSGINAEYILVPSRYGPNTEEVLAISDLRLALLSEDNHIFTSESIFDSPDVIPYYMEGQPGSTLDYKSTPRLSSKKGSYNTKYTPASKNIHTEDLLFTFNPADPQKIKVDRKTTLTGLSRLDYQRQLLLFEDFYEEERNAMGLKKSFYDELKGSSKGKKLIDEYRHAFEEARTEWKENFKDEISTQFDVKPLEVISCNIEQSGVFANKPAMIYTTQFTVNAWVKKAGNNFILDAGKMIGTQLHIKADQRERNVDAYLAHARTLQYNVSIPVPKGYSVEGLDKLNTNLDSPNGSFITTAKLDGSTIKITVTKVYKNAFVKAADWPQLLQMLDAAVAFEDAKILFRKS